MIEIVDNFTYEEIDCFEALLFALGVFNKQNPTYAVFDADNAVVFILRELPDNG